jgi:hypothetical protein
MAGGFCLQFITSYLGAMTHVGFRWCGRELIWLKHG